MKATMMESFTGLSQAADVKGFVVVYPDGTGPKPLMSWNAVLPSGTFAQVVRHHWPEGWPGMVLRSQLPRDLSWSQIRQSLAQLRAFRRVLGAG